MAWAGISVTEFLAEGFSTDERASVQQACGGDDGLSSILAAAIAEWRGVIEAAGYDVDATTTTVPPSCRRHIIAQVRWQLLIKLSQLKQLQTEERKAAAVVAEGKLEKIEDGDASVESPESPAEDQEPGPSFTAATLNFTADDQDGI
jgi:hypothetical protein